MGGLLIDDPIKLSKFVIDNNVIPGDTILLLPGIYTVPLEIQICGTQALPITFRPYEGGEVILRPSSGFRALHCANIHDLRFENIIIDAINVDTEPVKLDSGSKRITFDACEFKNGATGGISILGETTEDCDVINCSFHDIGTTGFHHGIYLAQGATGSKIHNNIVYNCSGHGIHAYSTVHDSAYYTIKYNYVHDVGSRGIGIYYGNAIVSNNIIRNCPEQGIALFYDLFGAKIYFNTIINADTFSIYVYGLTNHANVDIEIANNFSNGGFLGGVTNAVALDTVYIHDNLDDGGTDFVDNGGTDVYPTANATGVNITGYDDDFNGKARVVPTIGAIEI